MRGLKWMGVGGLVLSLATAGSIGIGSYLTERDIAGFQAQIADLAIDVPNATMDNAAIAALPEPVQRYFAFVFPQGVPNATVVRLTAQGQFRRPQTDGFHFTTAEQVIAVGTPALMFSATTPVAPGIWARAYDYFADGEMEMKAKILSLITVVDERETPSLNVISLRRWLLESALFPQALLPGGPVTWEAVDASSARAIVTADGLSASMIAHFDLSGRMTHMLAEEDGDLTTPYHGSGEHVTRADYRIVDGVAIPHQFTISRMANGEMYPFFDAALTGVAFD